MLVTYHILPVTLHLLGASQAAIAVLPQEGDLASSAQDSVGQWSPLLFGTGDQFSGR